MNPFLTTVNPLLIKIGLVLLRDAQAKDVIAAVAPEPLKPLVKTFYEIASSDTVTQLLQKLELSPDDVIEHVAVEDKPTSADEPVNVFADRSSSN